METLRKRAETARRLEERGGCPDKNCRRGKLRIDGISLECSLFGSGICELAKRMDRTARASLKAYLKQRGIPIRHLDSMARMKPTGAVTEAKRWNMEGNLVLSGGVGIGKSFAAALALCRWAESRMVIRRPCDDPDSIAAHAAAKCGWFRAAGLLTTGEKAERMRNEAARLPLIVVDDLGTENGSGWAMSLLSDIMAERYDCERQTIITTNIGSMDRLAERYDARIADRILAGGIFAPCTGTSMR